MDHTRGRATKPSRSNRDVHARMTRRVFGLLVLAAGLMAAAALRRGARLASVALDPVVRMSPLGGEVLPRADVRLPRGPGGGTATGTASGAPSEGASQREVHFYEAYWAPIPEGRVSLRDVLAFL